MRNILFSSVSYINTLILNTIKGISDTAINITLGATAMLLKIIDRDRMNYAESAAQQHDEINELQILANISEIRNDAVKHGEWNEDHESKLNFFGNLLCNHYNWEVNQVERYLHEVIATGPSQDLEE
jgi:hypothetical protein